MQKHIQHDLELKPTYPVKDLYTVKEVSEILIVNVNVVYDLIKSGTLRALKLGRYKIRRTTLLDRKSTRLNSSHSGEARMPSSA